MFLFHFEYHSLPRCTPRCATVTSLAGLLVVFGLLICCSIAPSRCLRSRFNCCLRCSLALYFLIGVYHSGRSLLLLNLLVHLYLYLLLTLCTTVSYLTNHINTQYYYTYISNHTQFKHLASPLHTLYYLAQF